MTEFYRSQPEREEKETGETEWIFSPTCLPFIVFACVCERERESKRGEREGGRQEGRARARECLSGSACSRQGTWGKGREWRACTANSAHERLEQ